MAVKLEGKSFNENIELIKISDVNKPINGLTLNFVDCYWIVKGEYLLKLKDGSYLCNVNKDFLELHILNAPNFYKDCEILKLPCIFFKRIE